MQTRQRPSLCPGSRVEIAIADGDSPEAAKLLQEPTDFAVRHRTKREGFGAAILTPWAQASVLAAEFVHARESGASLANCALCKSIRPLCRGWAKMTWATVNRVRDDVA